MTSCQCQGIEATFDKREADQKLSDYHKKGPAKTTRLLIDALQAAGVDGATLLDIGGGIGAIQIALLKPGARSAVSVDASSAYLAAARDEAGRQGLQDRIRFEHGDFVDLAAGLLAADVVTLDRSVCCYPDMPALVGRSASRAGRLYGLVYPRDTWWMKLAIALINLVQRIGGRPFRVFVHPSAAVEAIVSQNGLRRRFYRRAGMWQVVVFGRA